MQRTDEMLKTMIDAARQAGELALAARAGTIQIETKADRSPVTNADRWAEEIIVAELRAAFPAIPVVAEEAFSAGRVPRALDGAFFLVDPIDGTREYIAGREEFTVNMALVEKGYPIVGVVHAPALDRLYLGSCEGAFAIEGSKAATPIRVRAASARLVALASRSHRTRATDDYLRHHGIEDVTSVGSSLKFCRLAEGAADLYPCFGPTMEWDTAAGQAVLEASGGSVRDADGERLSYAKCGRADVGDFLNPHFVAFGGISLPTS